MKKILIVCIMALVASCSHNPFSKENSHKRLCKKIFKMQDANNDEVITKQELTAHHKAQFNKIDADHNGKLTRAEAKSVKVEEDFDMHGNKAKKGHLTFKETLKIEEERFKKADTNRDGKVSKKEFKKNCKAGNSDK